MFRPRFLVYATRQLVAAALGATLAIPAAIWGTTSARMPGPSVVSGGAMPGQATPESRQPGIQGIARVVDGDTIEIDGTRIRLEGIDAPEGDQQCASRAGDGKGSTWRCGQVATEELQRLVGRTPVRCDSRGLDKYGRTLAICFSGATDVNAEMVRRGFAWAFVKYSSVYVAEEAEARTRGVGIWQAPTVTAWDHRAGRWAQARDTGPVKGTSGDCVIKGNITNGGRIYHMPWSPWYEKVRIETTKGERWFCNENEAVAAGWRPVRVH
jgi:endonuclease YncB( thermonuclease family)